MEEIKEFIQKEVATLKETKRELKGFKPATPKMLKLANVLAKETGLNLPKEKSFEAVREFIKKALERKKELTKKLENRKLQIVGFLSAKSQSGQKRG